MDPEITRSILIELNIARASGKEAAILFDRISHSKQEDGMSLEYQGAAGKAYAERSGLHVCHAYMVVESAYKENRKNLLKILDTAEHTGIRHLIFKNADRLSRNISHVNRFKQLIDEKGFTFHFYETNTRINAESTYDEKWLLYFFILVAQRLSMKNSHDQKEVYKYKAGKGIPNFRPPDGYAWSKELKRPVINRGRENVIRFMMDEWDTGKYSLQSLADLLNANGIQTTNGHPWRASNLHRVLINPFYSGRFMLNGKVHDGVYETYIDQARFKRRMEYLGIKNGKYTSREFPLSRMLKCASCGAILSGEIKKGKYIYYSHKCGRAHVTISEAKVMSMIDAEASAISMNEEFAEFLKMSFKKSIKMKEKSQAGDLAEVSKKISSIETKTKKLMELFSNDEIPIDLLQEQIKDFQRQREALMKRRAVMDVDKDRFILVVADIIDTIRRISKVYEVCPPQDKGELLREISDKIIIGKNSASIHVKAPFNIILEKKLRGFMGPAGVREFLVVLAQQDEYRTYIEESTRRIIQYMAA